jgi:hypothetical protein
MKNKIPTLLLIIYIIYFSVFAEAQQKYRCGESSQFCRDDQTCCQEEDGSYGCCPYLNGICCEDRQHCCPNGYRCNLAKLRCEKGTGENFLQSLYSSDGDYSYFTEVGNFSLMRLLNGE